MATQRVVFAFYFGCVLLCIATGNPSEWRYEDEEHWGGMCKTGAHQSPIALSADIAQPQFFHPFIWQGYNNDTRVNLINNGHSAEVRIISGNRLEVQSGGLPYVYVLDHLHFHWQSEHTVEGYRFPLELHMVHFAKPYGTLAEAVKHPNGIAVFAILFDISPDDSEDFKPLVDILNHITQYRTQQILNFRVSDFLPKDKAGFYRYDGSLTTPQCSEVVIWTVFTDTIPISLRQVRTFENLESGHNSRVTVNYRALQDLNDRTVFLKLSPIRDGGVVNKSSVVLLIVSFIFFFLM